MSECPEIVAAKYLVIPSFNGHSIIQDRDSPHHSRWLDIGAPRVVASSQEIPWSGNGEMLYFLNGYPSDYAIYQIASMESTVNSWISSPQPELDWKALSHIKFETLVGEDAQFLLITASPKVSDMVMQTQVIRELPNRRQREAEREKQAIVTALGPERGPEQCKGAGCPKLRIELGVFCAEHHLEMLGKTQCATAGE